MNDLDRQRLTCMLHGLAEQYGPWAVLWEFTQAMKGPFQAQAAKDAPPKQPRKPRVAPDEPPVFVNPFPFE